MDKISAGSPLTKSASVSPRRKGIKTGIFVIALSFLVLSFLFLLTLAGKFHPAFFLLGFLLFFLGGIIRIIYALLFEPKQIEDFQTEKTAGQIGEAETKLIHSSAPRETIVGNLSTAEKAGSAPLDFDSKQTVYESKTEARIENKKFKFPAAIKYGLLIIIALVLGFGIYDFATHLSFESASMPPNERWKNNFTSTMNARRLTATGIVRRTVVSPDGKQIAYISGDNQNQRLRIRETDSETERELVAPAANFYLDIKFSPDGKYIYYLVDRADDPRILHRISTGGGASEKISGEVFNSFALSSDGQKIAYDFANKEKKNYSIQIADLVEGKSLQNPQFVTEIFYPDYYMGSLTFSPDDGKLMYAVSKISENKEVVNLFVFDFETKTETQLTTSNFSDITGGLW